MARHSNTCGLRTAISSPWLTLPEFPAARADDKLGLARILRAIHPQEKNHLKTRLFATDLWMPQPTCVQASVCHRLILGGLQLRDPM